jgi:MFS family permease
MKIDLVGPKRRGLALGLNEAAGYGGVALAAAASGWLAGEFVARDVLVVAGFAVAVTALAISVVFVRDTGTHVALEQARHHAGADRSAPRLRDAFIAASFRAPGLRACSQAGLVNNLNDALVWGLVPLFLAAEGADPGQIGLVAGIYPAVWGVAQIWTGHWSDSVGRKPLIVAGMLLQAAALALLSASGGAISLATLAAIVLGAGTALVYPTLLAAISDSATPIARGAVVGVYRFWRDMGYVVGGLTVGLLADAIDPAATIAVVAGLTALSGLWVAVDLPGITARGSFRSGAAPASAAAAAPHGRDRPRARSRGPASGG